MAELSRLGYRSVRTGALGLVGSSVVEDLDFELIQTLALLEHDDPGSARRPNRHVTRLGHHGLQQASVTDVAAFGEAWGIDSDSIADMATATPAHRMRSVPGEGAALAGYAVSGRDGRLGFLQRLAVDPAAQHQGIGTALVADCLRWLARWHVSRVLVNTHVDNHAALGLYHRMGFTTLPEQLRVFQRVLP
jgi:ribosomal protein S18 acetylase RimI-like enzyme